MTIIKATAIFKGVSISGLDTDALKFLNAGGILDELIRGAISTFVFTLKDKLIWDFIDRCYPFVGGTEFRHSFNLRNPDQNQLIFFGGAAHDANGWQPNGVTQYAATGFIPNTHLFRTYQMSHGGVYILATSAANSLEFGVNDVSDKNFELRTRSTDDTFDAGINGQFKVMGGITDDTGFMVMDKLSNTPDRYKGFRNGIEFTDAIPDQRNAVLSRDIYLGARNNQGTADRFSNKPACYYTFGETLTATQHLDYFNAVQTLQTTLGRNV